MTSFEIIKQLCANDGISVSALEKELSYGNGSLSKAKKIPAERIQTIAKRFNVPMEYLMNENINNDLNSADEDNEDDEISLLDIAYAPSNDIGPIFEALEKDVNGPLYFNGEPIDDETLDVLVKALEFRLSNIKRKRNKEKQ